MCAQMKYNDYYEVLGVPKTATEKEIRNAYRKLAKKFHPDANQNDKKAEARFKEISEAYEVLGTPDKRSKYDQLGANWEQYERFGGASGSPFGSGGRRGSSGQRAHFGNQSNMDFSDFFETFFGQDSDGFWNNYTQDSFSGGGRQNPFQQSRQSRPPVNLDITVTTEVTLEEVLNGTKRRIRQEGSNEIDVSLPAGIRDGAKIRVAGKGKHAGAQKGDLFVMVKVKEHPHFKVDGNDLRTELELYDYEALLGTERKVPTLTGQVQMKIPAGSQPGKTFRLKEKGLPTLKNTQRGDLFATVVIKISKDLTDEERQLIAQFRDLRLKQND